MKHSMFRAARLSSLLVLTSLWAVPVDAQVMWDRGRFAEQVDSLAAAFLADGPVAGVAIGVEKDGEVVLAKGYGLAEIEHNVPVTAETVFRLGSISKQFAAVAILQLRERGLVDLHDPMTRFIPDYPTQGHEVTIHHLLTHTSGIVSYTGMGEAFWNKSRLDLTHEEMIELFGSEPFEFAPGEQWNYNNSGYYLLGMIVEIAAATPTISWNGVGIPGARTPRLSRVSAGFTGTPSAAPSMPRVVVTPSAADIVPLPEYLEEHIFGPLGMTGSSYCDERAIVPHRAEGYEREGGKLVNDQPLSMNLPGAAGAFCSNVMDLLRWQRALDSNTVINAESRALMVTEAKLNDGSGTGYAYGLQLGDLNGHRKVSHGGGINGFNTQLSQYPDDNLVITVLTNTNGSGPQALESQIARLALGLPLEVTLDLPTDNVDLTRYEGSYNFEAIGATVQVEARADGLWILALGAAEMRLKYQGGDLFEMAPGQRIQFFPDADPPRADLLAGGGSITGIKESNE